VNKHVVMCPGGASAVSEQKEGGEGERYLLEVGGGGGGGGGGAGKIRDPS